MKIVQQKQIPDFCSYFLQKAFKFVFLHFVLFSHVFAQKQFLLRSKKNDGWDCLTFFIGRVTSKQKREKSAGLYLLTDLFHFCSPPPSPSLVGAYQLPPPPKKKLPKRTCYNLHNDLLCNGTLYNGGGGDTTYERGGGGTNGRDPYRLYPFGLTISVLFVKGWLMNLFG